MEWKSRHRRTESGMQHGTRGVAWTAFCRIGALCKASHVRRLMASVC